MTFENEEVIRTFSACTRLLVNGKKTYIQIIGNDGQFCLREIYGVLETEESIIYLDAATVSKMGNCAG